jgi:hypothetical protein
LSAIKLGTLAFVIEAGLAVLAIFGGPHGELGAWPWALQMPGILVMLSLPGDSGFAWRAAGVVAIQTACWYAICSLIQRRMMSRRRARTADHH